ncbi:MAG: class I SAM-dependent methyltransferase [Candidatus Bathyarchaeia archaeon]
MSEDLIDYDPRYWHNITLPEDIDVSRHFEYDGDALYHLRKWLRLDETVPKTIVEVGCGSGWFTEKLLNMTPILRGMVAVEPDDVLREYAAAKFSPKVKFLKGFVEDLPLPDDFADLTACHIVLHNLPDVCRAVSEMARVTESGGIVAAIEPAGGGIQYYPDPKLNELEQKVSEAYGKGIWDLRLKLIDYTKDLKQKRARYAEVFHSCGVVNVEAHGILSVFLLSDPRRDRQEILSWLKKRLLVHENDWKRVRAILKRGGLPDSLIQEHYQTMKAYLEDLIGHPERISKTHELEMTSRTVTIGFKPRENRS